MPTSTNLFLELLDLITFQFTLLTGSLLLLLQISNRVVQQANLFLQLQSDGSDKGKCSDGSTRQGSDRGRGGGSGQ